MAPTRALYLAFDACDHRTMRRLAAEGVCPNLARLLEEGAVVETVAPYGTFVGSTWKTVATGLEVGHHRYYNWVLMADGQYDFRLTSPREAIGTPFWETLSDRGRQLAVLDVPHAEVPVGFNGAFLKEWGCHDRHHGTGTWPEGLRAELDEVVGDHPYGTSPPPGKDDQFAPCDYILRAERHRTLDEQRQLYDLILGGLDAKRRASLHLLDRGGWDLFMSVVGESHCVGHQLWHVHDEGHPRHDPAARHILGDPVVEVYRRLDELLGEHLERVGPDTPCYVHLSHGMRPHYDGDHVLDEVLHRLDLTDGGGPDAGWRTRVASEVLSRAPARTQAGLRGLTAAALRRRIATAPPVTSIAPGPRADRRWFQVPNNTVVGAIRFNLIDREPSGLVADGPERERLTRQLEAGLLQLINVDTGRPAILRIVRAEDVLERSAGDAFPDLFVEWDGTAPIERVWSPDVGTVYAPYDHWRTGDHHDRGLLVAIGPGIVPGHRAEPMSLTDVAPTLSAAIGEPLDGLDGSVREDLVGTTSASAAPALVEPAAALADERPAASAVDPTPRIAEGALELAQLGVLRAEAAQRTAEHEAAVLREATTELQRANLVWTTMRWLQNTAVEEDRLITVITPTHDRPEALAAAIESVREQTYGRWELVVVDDGGDTAKSVVAEAGDERIRALAVPHGGPAAARNAGLDAATGSVITYLDDDNTLDPGWLKAVAWAFQTNPACEVLYGARVIDDRDRVHGLGTPGWPWLQFNPFDRARLQQGNLADMGVLAHAAGLPEARFDERLWEYADWDLFLALTEHRAPVELPAIAVYYRTTQAQRLSGAHEGDEALVLRKWTSPAG